MKGENLKSKKGITIIMVIVIIVAVLILAGVIVIARKTKSTTQKEEEKLPIGEYVEYDIEYTDICGDSYYFTKSNGWRILSVGEKNADGSYSDVKIISTGVPTGLYFSSADQNGNNWWATEDTRGVAYQAATGLSTPENFSKIVFNCVSSRKTGKNQGYYTKIVKEGTEYNTNGKSADELFKTNKAKEVDTLTLEELNQTLNELNKGNNNIELRSSTSIDSVNSENDATSLFYIRGLNIYSDMAGCNYWLAYAINDQNLKYVLNGRFNY